MKRTRALFAAAPLLLALSTAAWFSLTAAAPKRLLLVTTTLGFRHAAVPLQEQVVRALAKSTGEFTIVSTTDSPDFPAAAYQSTVDQRNQRIPADKAYPNDVPALAGGFDGPRGTPKQLDAVARLNTALAPLTAAASSATAALNNAIFAAAPDTAAIQTRVEAETNAELAVANTRLTALSELQSSPDKLAADQKQALAAASGGRGGFGGAFGRGRSADTSAPLSPAQQSAIAAMNAALQPQTQAAAAARAALQSAVWNDGATAAVLKSQAAAFYTAELALANAKAAAFAKLQASPEKLDPAQFQLAAQGGNPGPGRGGRGAASPDPTTAAVARVLNQYLSADALKNYDAIAFLSTTGELPLPDKDAFFKWIADGHGFIGLHSAGDTLHQTPEYIKMLGAEFATHGTFHPKVPVENIDPSSPLTAGWGKSVAINEEFYLFRNYDPKQVHLLLAMPYQPYTKEAGSYPVSWIKKYGNGRVFYTSLGHRDDVLLPDGAIGDAEYKVRFNQAPVADAVQKHILQGIRYALGLIDADATPQAARN